jgi:uncharacterized protein YutE (UPF0331/DUF86 family)
MGLVDKTLIGRKIAQLDTYLGQIQEYSRISMAAYQEDWKTQRIAERTLQILVELCIDMANHIISDEGMRLPGGYADTFRVLVENKIINRNLFSKMEKMAKFRNVVVHQYEKINPAIVVSILHHNLKDFDRFKKAIRKYLSSTEKGGSYSPP